MNPSRHATVFTAAALAFCIALGAAGCLASAFDLAVTEPVWLTLALGIYCILASAVLTFRYGGVLLLGILALGWVLVSRESSALQQVLRLLEHCSTVYDRAYGWGILQLAEAGPDYYGWPLAFLGIISATASAWCVCRCRRAWPAVLATVLPLCSCIVVTDTVPDEHWLLMVMAGLILLVLTGDVRQENAQQGLRLTAWAALPVVLALMALFLALPQEGYVNHSGVLLENLTLAVQNVPQLVETGGAQLHAGLGSKPPRQVDLAQLGARIPFTYPVMEVTADHFGTIYLREQAYDRYDGLGWTATADREEVFSGTAESGGTITIHTKNRKHFRFLPYYPAETQLLLGGSAENPGRETQYTLLRTVLPENWRQTASASYRDIPEQWPEYLDLPESTRKDAAQWLEGRFSGTLSHTEKADIIAALVTDSARYDLNTGKMPEGEPDFALWFLREGETGYCVHFATAATVLLRASDIPARYVTGYMLEAEAGQPVTVTEEDAHAWAEYYEPNLGLWLPLEATPAGESPTETVRPRPVPVVSTEPAQTEAVQPTLPETQPVPQPTAAVQAPGLPPQQMPSLAAEAASLPLILVLLPLPVLVLPLQRSVRLALRRRAQRTGDPNRQALHRWRESLRLARILKESPTEVLIVLAQKAKFSQHRLTAEELAEFDSFNRSCLRRLKKKPWYLRLIYKFIYAAY